MKEFITVKGLVKGSIEFIKYIAVLPLIWFGFKYFLELVIYLVKPSGENILFAVFVAGIYMLFVSVPFYFVARSLIFHSKATNLLFEYIKFMVISSIVLSVISSFTSTLNNGVCYGAYTADNLDRIIKCEDTMRNVTLVILVASNFLVLKFLAFNNQVLAITNKSAVNNTK